MLLFLVEVLSLLLGFPGGVSGKQPMYQCRRHETFDPGGLWSTRVAQSRKQLKRPQTHTSLLSSKDRLRDPGSFHLEGASSFGFKVIVRS